jgi:hypothetical protein
MKMTNRTGGPESSKVRIEFNPQKDLLGYVIKRNLDQKARTPLTFYVAV